MENYAIGGGKKRHLTMPQQFLNSQTSRIYHRVQFSPDITAQYLFQLVVQTNTVLLLMPNRRVQWVQSHNGCLCIRRNWYGSTVF